jgi:hypothetical protein
MRIYRLLLISFLLQVIIGCNSSEDLDAALDLIDGVPRKSIDRSILGINAFANDSQFGTPNEQFRQVRDSLKISRVRILFAWNEQVQPTPSIPPDFSFYDSILRGLPENMRALVVLTDVPSWMQDSSNWIEGNPRINFVEQWVKPVVARYSRNPKIEGFQIFNEPNDKNITENIILNLDSSPENYLEMLSLAYDVVKATNTNTLVVSAATTGINQNFPETINYNRRVRDAGGQEVCDVWAMHYYGSQYENVLRSDGIRDFAEGLVKPIWITESGARGVNEQLKYGETAWPYLQDNIPRLQRIYIYQFTENSSADTTYGLRNPNAGSPVSDLFIWLRDN